MKNKNKNTLYCFSPPVMIATMLIEVALAVFVFFKQKKSFLKNLTILTLVLLTVFQLAEFMVCQKYTGISTLLVSRLGFVAITLLPPLGIHIANTIAGRKRNWSSIASYVLAAGFVGYFLVAPGSINDSICPGNYVIFRLGPSASMAYGVYYFTLLACLLALCIYLAIASKNKHHKQALVWLMIGALSFLVPTGIIYFIIADSINALPSVMCGFAVILAIILATRVVPLANTEK